MVFEKGKSGNPEGKKPGTKNRISVEANRVITKLLSCFDDEDIEKLATQLKEKGYSSFLKLLGSIAPKDINLEAGENLLDSIEKSWRERKK